LQEKNTTHTNNKQKEGKLILKMNILLKEICCLTLQCTLTNHTYINYIIKNSSKLTYPANLGIDV